MKDAGIVMSQKNTGILFGVLYFHQLKLIITKM